MTSFGLMGVSLGGSPTDDNAYAAWQTAVLPNPPYTGIQVRRVYYPGIPSGAIDGQIQTCINKRYKACVSFNPTLSGNRTGNNLPSLSQMQTDQNAMVAYLNTIVTAFTTAGMTPISSFLSVSMAHEPTNPSSPATCTAAQFVNIYSTAASGGLSNYTALHAICPVWIDLLGNSSGANQASSYFPTGACDGVAVDYYGGNYIAGISLSTFSNLADANSLPFSIWETGNTAGTNIPTKPQMQQYLSFLNTFFAGRITSSLPIGEILWFQKNGANPGYNIINSSTDYRVPYLQTLNAILNPGAPPPPPPLLPPPLAGPGGPVTLTYGPASALDAVLSAANMGQGALWPMGPAAQYVALDQVIGTALMPNPTPIPSTLVLQSTPPLALPSGTAGWTLVSDANGNLTLGSPASLAQVWTSLLTPVTKTGAYTLSPGDLVLADTSSGAVPLTLPTAPPDKTIVGAKIYKQPGSNTSTVTAGGADTFDGTTATSRTLTLLLQSAVWQYNAALATWVTLAGNLGLTQLDARYFLPSTLAADFQPDGVAAAGANGRSSDSGHVHPNAAVPALYTEPTGATAATFPRALATVATGAMTSGTLYLCAIGIPKGTLVSNLTLATKSTALTGLAHGWYVLLDSGLVVRAVTADQTTGSWLSAINTPYTLPVGSAYTTTYGGLYYIGVMANATGMPVMAAAGTMASALASAAPVYCGSSSTAQTTPPTTGTTMAALTAAASFTLYGYTS